MKVFHEEATAINHLYWVTRYCYSRISELFTAQTQHRTRNPDPRIDDLWPSGVPGEQRQTTFPLSKFGGMQESNLATLRRTSVLYACSSFENFLSNTYLLLGLYHPLVIDPGWGHGAVPALLSDAGAYQGLKQTAAKVSSGMPHLGGRLRGRYPARISNLCRDFSLPPLAVDDASLNSYYQLRHLIAHDQGIEDADCPDDAPRFVLQRRLSLSEGEWTSMIDCFLSTAKAVDEAAHTKIPMWGAHIAVHAYLRTAKTPKLSDLRRSLIEDWNISLKYADIQRIVADLGRTVCGNNRPCDLVVQ